MTDIQIILINTYWGIAALSGICTAFGILLGLDFEEIEGFWDWVIYNILWIKHPLKSIFKFITTNWRD